MVRIGLPLAGLHPEQPDPRLAEILADSVRMQVEQHQLLDYQVALVDHGTPAKAVNVVRNAVAQQLGCATRSHSLRMFYGASSRTRVCFQRAIVGAVGESARTKEARALVLAMFFLLPGRHAGVDGDVAQICDAMQLTCAVHRTELMAMHSKLIEILEERFRRLLAYRKILKQRSNAYGH